METYLTTFGTLAALGGAVLMARGLIMHTTINRSGGNSFRPTGSMTPEGRKHFFRGVVLLVLAHVLRDIIPGMINAGATP